jgi:hypothetical protein
MLNYHQLNTIELNRDWKVFVAPTATVICEGKAPSIPMQPTTVTLTAPATATATAIAPQVGVPVSINVPVGRAIARQVGVDLVQILAHYTYRPRYPTPPRLINRVYVVGVASNDNMVYGESKDSDAITEYGEVLRRYADDMVFTQDMADIVAGNIRVTARLKVLRGAFVATPHCGLEQWDVIQLTDDWANQETANYRVAGWAFRYDTTSEGGTYEHEVRLTAV